MYRRKISDAAGYPFSEWANHSEHLNQHMSTPMSKSRTKSMGVNGAGRRYLGFDAGDGVLWHVEEHDGGSLNLHASQWTVPSLQVPYDRADAWRRWRRRGPSRPGRQQRAGVVAGSSRLGTSPAPAARGAPSPYQQRRRSSVSSACRCCSSLVRRLEGAPDGGGQRLGNWVGGVSSRRQRNLVGGQRRGG